MEVGGLAGIKQAVVLPQFKVRLVDTNGGPGCACSIRDASSIQASECLVQQGSGACAQLQEHESHPCTLWDSWLCLGMKTPAKWLECPRSRDGASLSASTLPHWLFKQVLWLSRCLCLCRGGWVPSPTVTSLSPKATFIPACLNRLIPASDHDFHLNSITGFGFPRLQCLSPSTQFVRLPSFRKLYFPTFIYLTEIKEYIP